MAKNRPKIFAISNNFRLWSRICPERIYKSKIEKAVDQLRPFPRWAKEVFESWSTNEKGIDVSQLTHLSAHFSGDCIFALRGLTWVLTHLSAHYSGDCIFALKEIFTRARDWPRFLAHTQLGRGSSKKFQSWKCKIWLKIQRIHVNKFGTNGDTITDFYPDDVPRARGYNLGTIFGRLAP